MPIAPFEPIKKSLSVGFTLQLDEYEPIKLNIMTERMLRVGEREEDLILSLAKTIADDFDKVSSEMVKKIQSTKAQIWEDLSDGDSK